MTKRREPLTFHRALTVIAARIGWDKCAMVVGRSERLVRMWSDPDADSEISILDAFRLDRAFIAAGGDHGPFHQVFTVQLELAARESASTDLAFAAGKAARESGEAVSALIEAAASGDPARACGTGPNRKGPSHEQTQVRPARRAGRLRQGEKIRGIAEGRSSQPPGQAR